MRKCILFLLATVVIVSSVSAQVNYWSANNDNRANIIPDKAVARLSYPKEFKLFNLDPGPLRQQLFSIIGNNASARSTVITLPNAAGGFEQFEVVEASNFEPDLQAQFPDIRAYSGKGITDRYATLKLSISPQGIQTMVFRTDKLNEFIEAYSSDHSVYSVFTSSRDKGNLAWTCQTEDQQVLRETQSQVAAATGASNGTLKTLRLAQSCNGEYANWFGATSSAQVGLVLAAYNATLTRCNGVYEKDLAVHLNLIANTTDVIYYNPSTDPYSSQLSQWNLQLQQTLTSVIGNANYDIGHMFGASGGGGNAGCIGCVCVNPANNNSLGKGSGITSPADGIPQGDNFDIDYVVHEVGHQLGANHTFSHSLEGTGVNKEVGSGITIMGYAGITSYDVAPHSIDIFHEASIAQIQSNLATKTCPVTINMTANTAPVISPVSNYTIPVSTPFALTASATDAESDPLTYCWEQNDNSTTSGSGSVASPTKTTGPNWLSFSPVASGTRLFPKLSTILSGLNVSPPLPGGDAGANTEALSSVARTLNFRVTVRDNSPYNPGSTIGQTAFTDVVVTVANTGGAFSVTAPNTAVTWGAGSTATVNWNVSGTTGSPINCSTVNILLSTDGGNTFPTILAAGTANDGSELINVPSISTTSTCRVKVEAVGNIFFDISNTNFTIGAAPACGTPGGLSASAITQTTATVGWNTVSGANNYDVDYKINTAGTWTNAATATASTSVNLGGLTPGTLYDWRVRANCTGGSSAYAQSQFTTQSEPTGCPGIYDVSTNGTASGAATIPFNTDIKGLINPKGDNDYYKFIITTAGTITISLTNLPADYQLSLLDASGTTTLQSSTNSGTAPESINYSATPGTYYARVYPRNNGQNNATLCYTLRVDPGTATRMIPGYVDLLTASQIIVAPNPSNGNAVNLLFLSGRSGSAIATITDQNGAVVRSSIITVNHGQNSKKIDLNNLKGGLYYIRLQNGNETKITKLIVAD